MEILLLESIERVYSAYNDVKNTFDNLETEVNIDNYLQKLFNYGNIFGVYDETKNEFCGFAAVYMNNVETKVAFISLIGVSLKYKNKHIGTKLLHFVETQAANCEMQTMMLEVKKHNIVAIKFYQKNGYNFVEKESKTSKFMSKRLRDD